MKTNRGPGRGVPTPSGTIPAGRMGVLCGGPSAEREISKRSGRAIYEALLSLGLQVSLVELSEAVDRIPEELKAARIAYAFIALHGPFGEDGRIQSLLEDLKIPYTGSSVEASFYAMDKIFSRLRWKAAGLPVPRWVEVDGETSEPRIPDFGFPLVVKPRSQGSSIGMSIVDHPQDLSLAIGEARRFGRQILVEEYLPGSEVTVGILQDRPLPVVQIVPKRRFYDYVAKYTPGMCEYLVPAPLPEKISRDLKELALAAHQALGCRNFSRVDMILVEDQGPFLLELNTIPGMTPMSLLPKAASCAGIDFPQLCLRMLSSGIKENSLCPRDAVHSSA